MLWHMLLFGDAFGPAYAIFWCFCIQLCSFWGGSNFKKCFQQAITLLYGRFRRPQQCCVQRMCVQQYVCVYAKYTLCQDSCSFYKDQYKAQNKAQAHPQRKQRAMTRNGSAMMFIPAPIGPPNSKWASGRAGEAGFPFIFRLALYSNCARESSLV